MEIIKKIQIYRKYLIQDLRAYKGADLSKIFLISFPKSGATWLNLMLSSYFIKAYELDEQKTIKLSKLASKYKQLPKIVWTHDDGAIIYENGERPDPIKLFNYGWRFKYIKNKVILLVRDPRDIVVSHYHQVTKRSENPIPFSDISDFVRDPIYGFDRIIRFYNIWARNSSLMTNFLLVSYDSLLRRGPETLSSIIAFADTTEPSIIILQEVYSEHNAKRMREQEINNEIDGMRNFSLEENALKVRKAKAGTYKTELSADDIRYCNDRLRRLSRFYPYAS